MTQEISNCSFGKSEKVMKSLYEMIENILSSVVQCQKKKLQHKLLLKMVKDKTKANKSKLPKVRLPVQMFFNP